MEVRRILFGHLEDGKPDFRYREVIRNEEGTVVEYKMIEKSPSVDVLNMAETLPPLKKEFVE